MNQNHYCLVWVIDNGLLVADIEFDSFREAFCLLDPFMAYAVSR